VKSLTYILAALIIPLNGLFAQEGRKIQDNSFLIEEAYNQEPGVVQHIQSFQSMKGGFGYYLFVQEWPVPDQTHQISYSIPVLHTVDWAAGTAIGDLLLNYRYQLIFKQKEGVAFAPRISLILPTGNYKKGFGSGALGVQTNLPLSVELAKAWVTHWNIGATVIPGSKEPTGSETHTRGFNYGFSIIWLATENINLMFETAGNSNETVRADDSVEKDNSFFVDIGGRFAINFQSGLQIVPGIAALFGIGPSQGENGVFFYLSFEHSLF
jgi:hypothetical protein